MRKKMKRQGIVGGERRGRKGKGEGRKDGGG